MRVRSVVPLAVGLLPLLAVPAYAEEPQLSKRLVTKVFSVAELVTPIPDAVPTGEKPSRLAAWKKPTAAESAEQLVRLVTSVVRPYSWDAMGGPGKAEFYEIGSALVVNNTQEVVTEVGNLLDALRRLQDVSVCTEVRVLRVPAGLCEKAGFKLDAAMTECELAALLAAAKADRHASMTWCPKVTTFDGQVATVRCGEQKTFVTGVEAAKVDGKAVVVPKNTAVELGDTLTICGRVSADEKFVSLRTSVKRVRVVGEPELVPVVTQVTPVFEGGSLGTPVPFTQYVQAPDLKTHVAEAAVVLPSGGTVVIGKWKEQSDGSPDPAVLSKIPHVNRLYKNVRPAEYDVVVLATTRVVRPEPVAAAPAPREADARPVAFRLRCAAASDAAAAVTQFLNLKNVSARVTFDAPSNTVFVQGTPAVRERVERMIAEIDAAPPQVHVRGIVVEAPAGFLSDAGLTTDGKGLVLTPRELDMLVAHIRKEKQHGSIDILSRPQLQMVDNQAGFVQVGEKQAVVTGVEITAGPNGPVVTAKTTDLDCGLRLRVTPRINPGGEVLLRAEGAWSPGYQGAITPVTLPPAATGLREPVTFHLATGGTNVQTFETTTKVQDGHTVLIRAAWCGRAVNGSDGPFTALAKRCVYGNGELLVLLTPHVVRTEPVTPAAHAEPAGPKPVPAVMPPLGYGRQGSEPHPQR